MAATRKRKPAPDFLTPEDQDLLERSFDVDDPSTLTGLLDQPPDTDEVPEIEFAYDVTPPGGRKAGHAPNLTCIFPHAARHWRGYIVRWKNGARARVGQTCGADHWGLVFKTVEGRFDDARSRQGDLKTFIVLRTLLPEVVADLRTLPRHPSVTAFDDYRQEFGAVFPRLNHALGVIAQLGGHLRTTRQERDFKAEDDRVEHDKHGKRLFEDIAEARRNNPNNVKPCTRRYKKWLKSLPPIMKTVTYEAGILAGGGILTYPKRLEHAAAAPALVMSRLSDEITRNRSSHWDKAHPFSSTFKSIRDAIGLADNILRLLQKLNTFASPSNLARIATWTAYECNSQNPRVPGAATAHGRTLVCSDTGARLPFPEEFTLPTLPKLEDLRKLV